VIRIPKSGKERRGRTGQGAGCVVILFVWDSRRGLIADPTLLLPSPLYADKKARLRCRCSCPSLSFPAGRPGGRRLISRGESRVPSGVASGRGEREQPKIIEKGEAEFHCNTLKGG